MADDQSIVPWEQLGNPKPANNVLSKSYVREAYRQHMMPDLRKVWDAQLSKAMGIKHLVFRDAEGQFVKVDETWKAEDIEALLASGGTKTEFWTRDPDVKAIQDILDRTQDKPKEQEQEIIVHDGDRIRERLDAWKLANRKETS